MMMLYNSDSFAVLQIDLSVEGHGQAASATVAATISADTPPAAGVLGERLEGRDAPSTMPVLTHGGYEIVDKFARKEIFLQGAMAQSFKEGVERLIQTSPSEEEIDDYIGRFTTLANQPVILH